MKKGNSVAVTDNIFLKAYFATVIESLELQIEVRVFFKYSTKTYIEILEEIQANYWAQTICKDICRYPGGLSKNIALATRGTVENSNSLKDVDL